jgi:MGT family glycosyltransferase
MTRRDGVGSPKKTVAIFCDGGFLAHVTRSFEVGRSLHTTFGHRVVFCCSGPYAHIPRDAGFEVLPVYTVDRETTMKLARKLLPPRLGWWESACARSVASDLEVLKSIRPDAVVGDMHWSLSTSARVLGIPYVSIANACWTRWFTQVVEPPEGHLSARIFGSPIARAVFPVLMKLMHAYYALGYRTIRKRHGLPRIHTLWEAIEGDINLMPDLPEFMPVGDDLPPTFRYTGPLLWDATMKLPDWFSSLERGRPTVYVTFGSTGDSRLFQEAARIFGNTEFQVLITTGGLTEVAHPPPNVFIAKYAPGDVLAAASDVVVSHGGNGTVYQALSRGVPLVGIPTMFDQEINMRRVCALGAGLQIRGNSYSGAAFEAAVRGVFADPSYRDICRGLAARISSFDGRRCAALHIHEFLEHKDPRRQPSSLTDTSCDIETLAPSASA